MHDPEAKREAISGLIERYRRGEISEPVFTASLKCKGMRGAEISAMVAQNQDAFVNSLAFKRGEV